jgi:hypothetical protein
MMDFGDGPWGNDKPVKLPDSLIYWLLAVAVALSALQFLGVIS